MAQAASDQCVSCMALRESISMAERAVSIISGAVTIAIKQGEDNSRAVTIGSVVVAEHAGALYSRVSKSDNSVRRLLVSKVLEGNAAPHGDNAWSVLDKTDIV